MIINPRVQASSRCLTAVRHRLGSPAGGRPRLRRTGHPAASPVRLLPGSPLFSSLLRSRVLLGPPPALTRGLGPRPGLTSLRLGRDDTRPHVCLTCIRASAFRLRRGLNRLPRRTERRRPRRGDERRRPRRGDTERNRPAVVSGPVLPCLLPCLRWRRTEREGEGCGNSGSFLVSVTVFSRRGRQRPPEPGVAPPTSPAFLGRVPRKAFAPSLGCGLG